jgi:hypothetical protein
MNDKTRFVDVPVQRPVQCPVPRSLAPAYSQSGPDVLGASHNLFLAGFGAWAFLLLFIFTGPSILCYPLLVFLHKHVQHVFLWVVLSPVLLFGFLFALLVYWLFLFLIISGHVEELFSYLS